jgi:UDP-glucose 4-epimerase
MKLLITGGAGFVGSNLVEKLMEQKRFEPNEIVVYDNLSNGNLKFIKKYLKCKNFKFVDADLLDFNRLNKEMQGVDYVFHLAANSDIRKGTKDTSLDLKQNTLVTYNVLEAMRLNKVKDIIFTSSSVIYGEADKPTNEDYGPLHPISLYGASKLACEGLISAFCNLYDMKAIVFRFANVCGKNSTHGAIYEFIKQLKKHPDRLEFLANGQQRKPYIEVQDLIEGMMYCMVVLQSQPRGFYSFNIGPTDTIKIADLGDIVIEKMGLKAKKVFTTLERGWPGDVKKYQFDTSRLKALGWQPKYNSRQAVEKAVSDLCKR